MRGIALAILALPLGIAAWDVLWSVGFVASIVAFGVAWGAMRPYRLGSNGPFSRTGAVAVLVITVVTLVLAFVSGFAVDLVGEYAGLRGVSIPEALVTPEFWGVVLGAMGTGPAFVSLLLAGPFSLLACAPPSAAPAPRSRGIPSRPIRPAPHLMQDDDPKA